MATWTGSLIKLTTLSATLLASGLAMADARIDPLLNKLMVKAKPTEQLHVVVSFKQSGPIRADQLAALKSLGIQKGVTMRALPIAGVYATPERIKQLAKRSDVVSIFYNAPLRYYNREQRQISGAARVMEQPSLMRRAIPFSGKGVTVVVNDSGIDTTNPDLPLGTKVVDNVQAAQNTVNADFGIAPVVHLRNQVNTDTGSGHGTHCAGTVGGTGAGSNGLHRGAAPGADLVGYGSGGVLLILDAVGGLDFALSQQFAYRNPIRVVSNSWGTSGKFDHTNPVNISTYELFKSGIVSVFAAGNDGPGEDTHNPYAQAPWVISVGAGEKDGVLTDFSSRGKRLETAKFTMADGVEHTYFNQPTIVASGVNILSTRALTGALPLTGADADLAATGPQKFPYYTLSSGTSMATPHVAGVIALMLEANPNLNPTQVKDIIKATATNMSGRAPWEVGAGHLNAFNAVAVSARLRDVKDFGKTTIASIDPATEENKFVARAKVKADTMGPQVIPVNYMPAPRGSSETKTFEVAQDVVQVAARTESFAANTVALVLEDPNGKRYGSSITLPVLGPVASVSAPGVKGIWKVYIRGVGSVSGMAVDPVGVTDGVGAPETFDVTVSKLISGGFDGLDDTSSHPQRKAIEAAVSARLMDGVTVREFKPNAELTRGELARYLVMGANIRQNLPFNATAQSAADVKPTDPLFPFVEAVIAGGGVLRDLAYRQPAVMTLKTEVVNGRTVRNFRAGDLVSRLELAQSLVTAMGPAAVAAANGFNAANVTYTYTPAGASAAVTVNVSDVGSLTNAQKGFVQQAINLGILVPVVTGSNATVEPARTVKRGEYAASAVAFSTAYRKAEDGV